MNAVRLRKLTPPSTTISSVTFLPTAAMSRLSDSILVAQAHATKPAFFRHEFNRLVKEQIRLAAEVPVRIEIDAAGRKRHGVLQNEIEQPFRGARQRIAVNGYLYYRSKWSDARPYNRVEPGAPWIRSAQVILQTRIVDFRIRIAQLVVDTQVFRQQDSNSVSIADAVDLIRVQQLVDVGHAARRRQLLIIVLKSICRCVELRATIKQRAPEAEFSCRARFRIGRACKPEAAQRDRTS